MRLYLITERDPICQQCDKVITNSRDIIAHHKNELTAKNVTDLEVSLNESNIILLCFDCHNAIHERFGYAEKKVFIVYGMPLSGKSTFVQHNMRRGDILLDMDLLYKSISGLELYDKPDKLLKNILQVYDLLIDQIKTRYGQWQNAWIIGGFPVRSKRESLAKELGAGLIHIECTREEAIERLSACERDVYKQEYIGYIDRWIERFS